MDRSASGYRLCEPEAAPMCLSNDLHKSCSVGVMSPSSNGFPIARNLRHGFSEKRRLRPALMLLTPIVGKVSRSTTTASPSKNFIPLALVQGVLELGYYACVYSTALRRSIATIFMLTAAVTILLIGLVSEQITTLKYKDSGDSN
jgi:hypothetical protein